MITIITVNWNAYDFLELLIESVQYFSTLPNQLIVVDNSEQFKKVDMPNVLQIKMGTNVGHGEGLNRGAYEATRLFPEHRYLMFIDSDCHFLRRGWEDELIRLMATHDVVGGRGVPAKPIRPACMFLKSELGGYDWSASFGYQGHRLTPSGYDVAIRAYYQILAAGYSIGFLNSTPNRYGTLNGEEWCVGNSPFLYHHWHGSHLPARALDFPGKDLEADKCLLFSKIPWRVL